MHLINYDFYDLHALITFFRCNTEKTAYLSAIEQVIKYIDAEQITNSVEANAVRKVLNPYIEPQDEALSWVFIENQYTANMRIIKDGARYRIISAILKELIGYLGKDPERVYLLCDATHSIPLLLADEKRPQKAIASMIKPYRQSYDTQFLYEELKLL